MLWIYNIKRTWTQNTKNWSSETKKQLVDHCCRKIRLKLKLNVVIHLKLLFFVIYLYKRLWFPLVVEFTTCLMLSFLIFFKQLLVCSKLLLKTASCSSFSSFKRCSVCFVSIKKWSQLKENCTKRWYKVIRLTHFV